MFESHKFYSGLLWVPLHCCTVKQKDPSTDDIVYKGVNEVYVQVDALAKYTNAMYFIQICERRKIR